MRLDVLLRMVREITGRPDVVWCSAEMLNLTDDGIDGARITYADVPLISNGPNVGKLNWRKRTGEATRIITTAAFNEWVTQWEAAGNCATCNNSGEVLVSWHHIEGSTMRPCPAGCEHHPGQSATPAAVGLFAADGDA